MHIDVTNVPWPISVLKCSQFVESMKYGESLSIEVSDSDVKDNLNQLFQSLPGLTYRCETMGDHYIILLTKRSTGEPR